MAKAMKLRLKRDDNVMIMVGKDRGKTGKIVEIDRTKGKAVVQGLNMMKKAVKPKRQDEKGGIIEIESPIQISNVQIVCRKCGPTRIGYKMDNDEKIRICKKCGDKL